MKKKIIRVVTSDVSFELLPGQLKFLNNYYEVIGLSSPGGKVEKTHKNEGIRVETIKMERQISLINDIKSLYKLYLFFKKEKPYIVHSITPKAGLLSMIASFFARVPNRIHTFTGLIFPTKEGFFKKILILTDRILCACATKIFPEGEGVKKDLINYKITSKPLNIIANGNINGINLEYFNPSVFDKKFKNDLKEKLNINKDDIIFLFAGRLVTDKGINELVFAFEKLNKMNAKLLLVGDYEKKLDPLLPETLNSIKNNQNIINTGWVGDVRPYFSIADILMFPSYREGFPNVVIQAGAMGLPSIVTNISGCNEIIIEGRNGSIIEPKDFNMLFQKMQLFYNNKISFNPDECRSLITSRYEQKKVWKAILKEYNQL